MFALLAEIGAAVVVALVTWRAAVGSLNRNPIAGVRTRITMSSDRAWRVGHQAALRPTLISGAITVVWCVLSILVTPLRTPLSVIVASVVIVGGALLSTSAAHRAVRRAPGDEVETPQPPRGDV